MEEGTIAYLKQKYPPIEIEELESPVFQYDIDGPRLMIQKIENENFKSYAGIRTLGPFHRNFTCIIGPNGSGKSNVIDSMLFVFGFRASKIRSKKLSVLIHKSELFPNIKSCTVKVFFHVIKPHLDDDDKYDIVPNSSFVVSRTAFDDNSSIIKINDKKASNKEASDFLKSKGIDLDHNRFLILQGEVESIALMKPKAATEYEDGLLEYLEDIIGSNRFKKPLEQLYKNLDELCEIRAEKLSRVKAAEQEKKELEGVRNEAVKYLKLCNEIVVRKNIMFQIKLLEQNNLLLSAQETHVKVREELKTIENQIKKIRELRSTKLEEVKETEQRLKLKTAEYNKCHEEINQLGIEDTRLRDSRKHCKVKIDSLEESILKLKNKLEKFEKVPEESKDRILEVTKEKENLEKMKEKESNKLADAQKNLIEETKDMQTEKESYSAQIVSEESKLYNQESEISNLKCQKDLLLKNYQKEEDNRVKIEKQFEEMKVKLMESDKIVKTLSNELPSQKDNIVNLKDQITNSRQRSDILKNEVHNLKEQLNDRSTEETGNKTLKFLFDQQNLGKLSGVIGRLGDLAYVDPKYDVPISTACDRLDSIVCETIDEAQKCVEMMKIHKISRTAFVALDKLSKYEQMANKPFNPPANTMRLFDLFKIDDARYRGVFYFATRNTLVVDNVDIAKKINQSSRERHRMVTLKGELFETTGAMTGGGKTVMRGRIRTQASRKSVASAKQVTERKQLEKIVMEKEAELREISGNLSKMNMDYDELQRKIQENERMFNYHKNNLGSWQKNTKDLESKLISATSRTEKLKPNPKELSELEKSIKSMEEKFEKDSVKLKKLKSKVEEIGEDINKRTVAKLGCIESRLIGIDDKLKEKVKLLKNIEKSVMQAKRIVSDAEEQLEKDNLEKEKTNEELTEINKQLEQMIDTCGATVTNYNRTTEEVKELTGIKEEQEKFVNQYDEELKSQSQIKNQQNRLVREVEEEEHKFQFQVRQTNEMIKGLKLYTIPEDCKDGDYSFMEIVGATQEDALSSQSLHCGTNKNSLNRLRTYNNEELEALKMQGISYQDLETELQHQKPKLNAIDEYRHKEELYMMKVEELAAVTDIRDGQRTEIERLKKQRLREFTAGFNLITGKLKEMYRMITMGGDAELELVDSLDPFSEGIVFSVRPPKKSWKNISNLSGGEKTLSSLALVFALHHFKPTPFYVMDEIDAALDFKNVSIVANYIKERTQNAQFIIISLRNNMYELSDRLVGIYKPFGFTKSTVVNPKKLAPLLMNYASMNLRKDSGFNSQTQPPQPPNFKSLGVTETAAGDDINDAPPTSSQTQSVDMDM